MSHPCAWIRTLAALALLSAAPGPAAAAEALTYDGATSIAGSILGIAAARFERRTGVRLTQVGASGSGKALQAALAGRIDVAGVSRALTPAELRGHPYFEIIGYDALGVFVSPHNPVRVLSKEQLKGIYTGQIRNWSEVGGPDQRIVACSEPVGSGRATADAFRAIVLDSERYGPVRELDDSSDCLKLVAGDPAAVAPASLAYARPGVRAIPLDGIMPSKEDIRAGSYLLSRPLLLVTHSRPTGALKAFFEFALSPEGQEIVARRFVAVR